MKQFIVLLATILLGITLSGLVMGYRTTASNLNKTATDSLATVLTLDGGNQ